jgi:hypothetical protein
VLLPATGDPEFGIGGLFILWVLVTVLLGILIVCRVRPKLANQPLPAAGIC